MKNKLIELLNKITAKYYHSCWANTDKIADYLLANGVGVMPCKIGDSVYCIENKEHIVKTYIVTCMRFEWFASCTNFTLTTKEHDKLKSLDYREFCSYHIGKTVFLTKEEAEAKLKERESNGQ